MTLISPENSLALFGVFLAMAAVAAYVESKPIGKRLSAPVLILAMAMAAAHFSLIPRQAPAYNIIWTYLVPLAIAMFLLKGDLVSIFRTGGRVLAGFMIGMAGAAGGAVLAALLLDLGPFEAHLAAVFAATYTGGSLNFAAVAQAVEFREASQLSAALAIDNVLGTGYIVAFTFLARWKFFANRFPARLGGAEPPADAADDGLERPVEVLHLSAALGLAALICLAGEWAAIRTGIENYAIMFITLFAVAIATLGRKFTAHLRGEEAVAMLFMYLFFAMIGAGADVSAMLGAAWQIFFLVAAIFVVHIAVLLAAARFLKLSHAEIVVISLACIAGPPIAAAVAILFGWRQLVLPGIMTGIFGYIAGTFIGIAIYELMATAAPY